MRLTFPQTRKAWVQLIGATVTTAAIAWEQYSDLIPGLQPQTIAAIGGLLSAVAVFFVPNDPNEKQIQRAMFLAAGPNKFTPQTKAQPAPTEKPGRHPGESRGQH